MRVLIDLGENKYEEPLTVALRRGLRAVGETEVTDPHKAHIAIVWGMKSRDRFRFYRDCRTRVIVFDKGYVAGRTARFRVAVDAPQPGRYLMRHDRPGDRWRALPWSQVDAATLPARGDAALLALSTQKYCDWYDLGDAHAYAAWIIKKLRTEAGFDGPIIYRPKPSWAAKREEDFTDLGRRLGAEISVGRPFRNDLDRTRAVITHGSGAAIDAVLSGVSALVLCDEAAAAPVSSGRDLEFGLPDCLVSADFRVRWAHNLAYTQWTLDEVRDGTAWRHIREDMEVAQDA